MSQVTEKEDIMNKHTPGPWRKNGSFNVECEPGLFFLLQNNTASVKAQELRANARLIAAAPDLLEACKSARDYLERVDWAADEYPPFYTYDLLVEAIKKAEKEN